VADRICVARIGAAHGLRGEVKLNSFTADPIAVTGYGPLESEDGTRSFEIETCRPGKGFLVVRFKGVADRSAAERVVWVQVLSERPWKRITISCSLVTANTRGNPETSGATRHTNTSPCSSSIPSVRSRPPTPSPMPRWSRS